MTTKPWRNIITPHADVLEGRTTQAQFAADLSQVVAGTAITEYQDPVRFFERTYITEGMHLMLSSVARRLAGQGGDPVVQLQTAFGGGKTHSMLAVYHLASQAVPPSKMPGISAILNEAGINDLPKGRVAVLDGNQYSPSQPIKHGKTTVHTLWGELAWQIGKEAGYELVAGSDADGTAPGKEALIELFRSYGPVVVLMDEMVAYFRQFEHGKSYKGGTWESNFSFIQQITEAAGIAENCMVLASLPESNIELGGARGEAALETLQKYVGRKEAIWKPVAREEAFAIVRQRLFEPLTKVAERDAVVKAFSQLYAEHATEFPNECGTADYADLLRDSYPIHPEVFDRLYEDWSTLEKFQRTRGVLRLMALVIHRLWAEGNAQPLIMPADLPLHDSTIRNELVRYLPQGWDPVLERDVDGDRAQPVRLDTSIGILGEIHACRRSARTVFLGSAPSVAANKVRGIGVERLLLGAVVPGQPVARYADALARLSDTSHYLYAGNDRYWYDTRPNLRREMEERVSRLNLVEHALPELAGTLKRLIKGEPFDAVHVFPDHADIPDDMSLRLVVIAPLSGHRKRSEDSAARDRALTILKNKGNQPRRHQNRLLFLAPDQDLQDNLITMTYRALAWRSIVDDKDRLNLDAHMRKEAENNARSAEERLKSSLVDTYRWALAPMQEAKPRGGLGNLYFEEKQVSLNGVTQPTAAIAKALEEDELLITTWAPVHLKTCLNTWFFKEDCPDVGALHVWEATCDYCYLPRLRNQAVFNDCVTAGLKSPDFFGYAQGKDGTRYQGLICGQGGTAYLDHSSILIKPEVALQQIKADAERAGTGSITKPTGTEGGTSPGTATNPPSNPQPGTTRTGGTGSNGVGETGTTAVAPAALKKRFFGTKRLDPVGATMDFSQIMTELVQHFTANVGSKVTIKLDIEVDNDIGFDPKTVQIVKENARTLGFTEAQFDE